MPYLLAKRKKIGKNSQNPCSSTLYLCSTGTSNVCRMSFSGVRGIKTRVMEKLEIGQKLRSP